MKLTAREVLEFVADRESPVTRDEKTGAIIVHRVKYCGARSRNRNVDGTYNTYPLPARKNAQPLYEGAKVFVDHPPRNRPGMQRSYREQLGVLKGPFEHVEEGSFCDLHLNPKSSVAEQVAWDAEHAPTNLGLSHNALCSGVNRGDSRVMESIDKVRSVDVVCSGATVTSLLEGEWDEEQTDVKIDKAKLTEALEALDTKKLPERLRDNAAKAVAAVLEALSDEEVGQVVALLADTATPAEERIVQVMAMLAGQATGTSDGSAQPSEGGDGPEDPPAMEGEQDAKKDEKFAALEAKIEKLEKDKADAERRATRLSMLEASGILPADVSDSFRRDVLEASTDQIAKDRIADRKRLLYADRPRSGGRRHPVMEGAGDPAPLKTAADFRNHLTS